MTDRFRATCDVDAGIVIIFARRRTGRNSGPLIECLSRGLQWEPGVARGPTNSSERGLTMKSRLPLVCVLFTLAVTALAQEGVRNVDGPGDFNKFLTPGTID